MNEKVSILVHSTDFRGDHTSETCIALEYEPGETIETLMRRAGLYREASVYCPPAYDWIAIRLARKDTQA